MHALMQYEFLVLYPVKTRKYLMGLMFVNPQSLLRCIHFV